jgi:Cu2+-exporting ATPase
MAQASPRCSLTRLLPIALEALKKLCDGRCAHYVHKHQLKELDTDSTVPENPEEQAARQQLLVGTGTVVVNIAAALFAPSLFLVGIAGIIYQLRFVILSSYRELVNEKRLNVYSLTTLMLAGTIASGSFAALTLATLSASLMRWLIAKTESAAQRSVASTFLKHPRSVWTIVGELEVEVDFEQVQVGDTIVVNAGQMIPMDGVIIQGAASIDQRMLTGESRLVDKGPGDPALANTMVLAGRIIIRVERSGGNSLAAQIARALAETQSYRQELRNRTEHQLDRLVPPLLAISALTLPIWGINSSLAIFWAVPRFRMMYLAPITMLSFMHLASLRGILLKNGRTLERMREVDIVVFDKTGTLTLEQPAAGSGLLLRCAIGR